MTWINSFQQIACSFLTHAASPSPRSIRRLSWTSAPSSTSTGNSLRRRPTTCVPCSSNPTTPSRSPTYASFGTSWRGAVANFDLIHQHGVIALAQELFPVGPLTPGLKMLHGKQEVGEVFRSLLQRCNVMGNSSHASSLCVLPRDLQLQREHCQIGTRRRDVIGRCETELTRTPELLLTSVWNVDAAVLSLEGLTPKHLERPLVVDSVEPRHKAPVQGDGPRPQRWFMSDTGW